MTPQTVKIVCARAPRHIVYVPAVRGIGGNFFCGWCGARVKVVA